MGGDVGIEQPIGNRGLGTIGLIGCSRGEPYGILVSQEKYCLFGGI